MSNFLVVLGGEGETSTALGLAVLFLLWYCFFVLLFPDVTGDVTPMSDLVGSILSTFQGSQTDYMECRILFDTYRAMFSVCFGWDRN